MIKQALHLWRTERLKKGTTLQRRLIAFFAVVIIFIIASFMSLLLVFDITGSGKSAAHNYVENEVKHTQTAINNDFGRMVIKCLSFTENLTYLSNNYLTNSSIQAEQIQAHPEILESLLYEYMQPSISLIENNICSGVFVILDASVKQNTINDEHSKAGIFIKKTQPLSSQTVTAKKYFLRGPANIARKYGIELLGQWKMEYDTSNVDFLNKVIESAMNNPEKDLSRLYYLTPRVTLKDNSESGFMLCFPMRTEDGYVYGICGMEMSDRMFKQLYCPAKSSYPDAFTLMAPSMNNTVAATKGMVSGNYYLTGSKIDNDLVLTDGAKGFEEFSSDTLSFGGLHMEINIYPFGSVYEDEIWSASVMMPYNSLNRAITGNTPYLLVIALFILIVSLSGSVFISRHYLRPLNDAMNKIKRRSYNNDTDNIPYLEINDLMEFLSKLDNENKELHEAVKPSNEDLTPMFKSFLENIQTLSPAERNVFELYMKGYKAQQIADELYLSINTIKTHNRRIFSKLNVSSRNELLVYIDMMKEMNLDISHSI